MNHNPLFEKIEPSFGNSFTLRKFDSEHHNSKPIWHVHPELEIVYIKEGNGKRHIGSHISHYYNGDLIVVGPNLPHYGFTDRMAGIKSEIVVQMKYDFLGESFLSKPEMLFIDKFFIKSKGGLSFHGNTKKEVGERLESMFYMSNFEKLLELLKILQIMAVSKDFEVLNVDGVTIFTDNVSMNRLEHIFAHVRQEYQAEISLETMAAIANMTVPSFCRFFKQNTNKTFIEFLNEYRITQACKLLSESGLPISEVCFESGYNNFSHFNRYFKKITGKSPKEYRNEVALMVVNE